MTDQVSSPGGDSKISDVNRVNVLLMGAKIGLMCYSWISNSQMAKFAKINRRMAELKIYLDTYGPKFQDLRTKIQCMAIPDSMYVLWTIFHSFWITLAWYATIVGMRKKYGIKFFFDIIWLKTDSSWVYALYDKKDKIQSYKSVSKIFLC